MVTGNEKTLLNGSQLPLQADSLGFSYSKSDWQLADICLELTSGMVLGIIGPNGAGKSTLIRILAGVESDYSGTVELFNTDMRKLHRRKIAAKMAYLPQSVNAVFDFSVEEIVAMGRFPHISGIGILSSQDREIIDKCMCTTQVSKFAKRKISQLSGGERQRVMLASVLAQQPEVLLLDEPTAGLDLHHQVSFFNLLKELAGKGMAIAVVTHDLNLAAHSCGQLLLLKRGSVVKHGSVEQVLQQETITKVYGQQVYLSRHPATNQPVVLPYSIQGESRA